MNLVPGQNCPVPTANLRVEIYSGKPIDACAFCLYANGKTKEDEDFIFYGQKANSNRTVALEMGNLKNTFLVNLPKMRAEIQKVAFALSSDFKQISELQSLKIEVWQDFDLIASGEVDLVGRQEASFILGELYLRNNAWKFRFISQGFIEGLKPLAENYGVEVEEDKSAPSPAPDPTPQPSKTPSPAPSKINLSKVVLTKNQPKIDLEKKVKGLIKVNLNWNRNSGQAKSGFFSKFLNKPVDLDLGAYVRLRDGNKTIIQALGDNFGSLKMPPYVLLLGDDRTGESSDGEWLHINAQYFDEIEEIVIYTFIYSGVANWQSTDAVTRIIFDDLPEIETRLTEGDRNLPMCAIARISNVGGTMRVERLDRYFNGHRDMDRAFGWGFDWVRGSK